MAEKSLLEPPDQPVLKRGDALLAALSQFDPEFAEVMEEARRHDLPQQLRENLKES